MARVASLEEGREESRRKVWRGDISGIIGWEKAAKDITASSPLHGILRGSGTAHSSAIQGVNRREKRKGVFAGECPSPPRWTLLACTCRACKCPVFCQGSTGQEGVLVETAKLKSE